MNNGPKLAGVTIGDFVTIVNAYGREVRGRVVEMHADGHCTLAVGDVKQLRLRADESNVVRVEHRLMDDSGPEAGKGFTL